ncbi:hypothetical protein P20495_2315 [Pseudoalteromonas sp. BSi20495]|nr:hypothetical protein P20495_2315 [Pseudoalteromonas sp. BSi20495]
MQSLLLIVNHSQTRLSGKLLLAKLSEAHHFKNLQLIAKFY